MNNVSIKKLTFSGLMIALVFVTTFSIKIPVPFTQGYIHGGDSMIFISAILLGWRYGAVAGGIGSALADIAGGYAIWALPTLIIKAIMGAIVGWIAKDLSNKKNLNIIISIIMALIWFAFIYVLRTVISNVITSKSTELISQIDSVTNIDELLILSQKLQNNLLLISILIPVVIIFLSIYLYRIDKNLFAVNQLLGMMIAGLWMVVGYYISAGIMYGNFIVPIFSIPWNIVQFVVGLAIAYTIVIALRKTSATKYFENI